MADSTHTPAWLSLGEQLPPWPYTPRADDSLIHAYLDFYQINFARQRAAVHHQCGQLPLAGYRIATHSWVPTDARGTLVLVHGYYDHVGIYAKAIRFALDNQLAVLAFDLPGHGLSSGERVAIDSFDTYANVLAALLDSQAKQLPGPLYALGQSTGGAVLLNHLWRYPAQAAQIGHTALCAPLILPRGWSLGRFIYPLLHPFVKRLARSRSANSHDADFLRFINSEDPLQSKSLSLQWVGAMRAWNQQFRRFSPLPQPLLVVQGSGDKTVAWRYNLRQIQHQLPQAQVAIIDHAGHQLVNEREDYRQQVFLQISRFFFDN